LATPADFKLKWRLVSPFEKKIVPKFETHENSIFIFEFYDS
jgi:hypothetical protein